MQRFPLWRLPLFLFPFSRFLFHAFSYSYCTNYSLELSLIETATANPRHDTGREKNFSKPGRIFFCYDGPGDGMIEIKSIFRSVVPEYSFEALSKYLAMNPSYRSYDQLFRIATNNKDIFLGLSYPLGCGDPITQWLLLAFRGAIVIYSPESPHHHPDLAIMRRRIHYFLAMSEKKYKEMVTCY